MALPSSGPISSSQVATEFEVSLTNISLSNLGTQLSDPITAGQPVELANDFYGQSGGVTLSSFGNFEAPGGGSFESSGDACSEAAEGTITLRYFTGTGTTPVNGDEVYETNNTSTPLEDGYYAFNAGRSNFSYYVSDGTVSSRTVC
jgi:hypothetical protein